MTALVGIWMIFNHPLVMLGFVATFVIAVAWMAPKVWRGLRGLFRRAGGRGSGSGPAQSRAPEGGGEVALGSVQRGG